MPTRRTWIFVIFVLLLTPWLLGASGCDGGGGAFGIDENSEIRIGQQSASDIEAQYGVVYDPVQTPRIQRIGRSIAAVSQRPELPWSFKILNTNEVNAESLPGGPVYVTRGLLALGVPDDELAGVIGHEVAHINQRHSVKAIQRTMTASLLEQLAVGNSGRATQAAADMAVQLAVQLPHSRQDEYEADAIGIRFAYNAGYPANGLVIFLQRLAAISGPQQSPAFLQTHPLTSDRIVRAQQIVTQVAGQPRPVPVVFSAQEINTLAELEQEKPATEKSGKKPKSVSPAPVTKTHP